MTISQVELLKDLSHQTGPVRIMEFCGGHTHALVRSGLLSLLPENIKLIHGPGCPVCVLPPNHIQAVIDLLNTSPDLIAVVYGDLMRIPTLDGDSLLKAKSRGSKVKVIYSPLEIIKLAQSQPQSKYLFVAIGFETTAPATALLVQELKKKNLKNVFIYCLHVLTPPAVNTVMQSLTFDKRPQALIGPGHVSLVTGLNVFQEIAAQYKVPIVISGFEGVDLLKSLLLVLKALLRNESPVINEYHRALRPDTHLQAESLLAKIFEIRDNFYWRGLGKLPLSSLQLKSEWSEFDAEKVFSLKLRDIPEHPACKCPDILRGEKSPRDCKLFGKVCKPTSPYGACMVSSEGACHAYYQYSSNIEINKDEVYEAN